MAELLFILLGVAYLCYYRIVILRKPELVYASNPQNKLLIASCPSLHRPYRPPLWAINCHVQIGWLFIRDLCRPSKAFYEEETPIEAPDGGHLSIQWYGLSRSVESKPVLILLPTICGSGQDLIDHAKAMYARLGWTIAVCNRRGHAHLPLRVPKINLLGCIDDLDLQLDSIQKRFPHAPLYAYGLSAGSALLVRYLGRKGVRSRIRAAVANSPGYNTEVAFRRFYKPYDYIMTKRLKRYFLKRHEAILQHHHGFQACWKANNLDEFHKSSHALAGYRSLSDFFKDSNPMVEAASIATPLMVLNAKDDPVCVSQNIYEHLHLFQELPFAILAMTRRGSHCAFWEGWFGRNSWADRLASEYLMAIHKAI